MTTTACGHAPNCPELIAFRDAMTELASTLSKYESMEVISQDEEATILQVQTKADRQASLFLIHQNPS